MQGREGRTNLDRDAGGGDHGKSAVVELLKREREREEGGRGEDENGI